MEIHEILKSLNSERSRAGALAVFTEHKDNLALRYILQGSYDDRISSYLPEGSPPFKPLNIENVTTPIASLNDEAKTIFNFFKFTWGESQPLIKQELEFIKLLESVHPEDADVLIRMKDKKLHEKYKRLRKPVVKELLSEHVPDLV